jgi:hypothetical protein
MQAFVRVDTHPFQAITDEKGQFAINGVPPGTYRLGMFHERFRAAQRDPNAVEVTVQAGEETSVNLTLPE